MNTPRPFYSMSDTEKCGTNPVFYVSFKPEKRIQSYQEDAE